jgi:hypothetical protein
MIAMAFDNIDYDDEIGNATSALLTKLRQSQYRAQTTSPGYHLPGDTYQQIYANGGHATVFHQRKGITRRTMLPIHLCIKSWRLPIGARMAKPRIGVAKRMSKLLRWLRNAGEGGFDVS